VNDHARRHGASKRGEGVRGVFAKRDWRTAKAWLNRELGSEVRP